MGLAIFLWVLYFVALYFSIFILSIFLFEPGLKPSKLVNFPKVSIIIPAWNEEKSIRETVESALNLDYPKDKLQVIAVDHGSKDGTGRILSSMQGIKVVSVSRKAGDNKAVAFNKALEQADGEFVACLDADSLVDPRALRSMLPYFMDSERVAVVTPMMLVKTPRNLLQRLQKYEYIVSLFIKRLASHINCIYVAPGPFSVYRTSILKGLGGFDEDAIAEDMEIVYRLQRHQYEAKQCLEGGYSYALAPKTIGDLYKQRERWYGGSLSNIYKYRGLTLNRKYGDFGFFQMPRNLLGVVTVFTTLGLFVYFAVRPVVEKIYQGILIKFEFAPYITSFGRGISIFDFKNVTGMFIVFILIGISLSFFLYACYSVGERFNKRAIPTLLVFFTGYPLLLCSMYLLAVVKKVARRKFVWAKVKR